ELRPGEDVERRPPRAVDDVHATHQPRQFRELTGPALDATGVAAAAALRVVAMPVAALPVVAAVVAKQDHAARTELVRQRDGPGAAVLALEPVVRVPHPLHAGAEPV